MNAGAVGGPFCGLQEGACWRACGCGACFGVLTLHPERFNDHGANRRQQFNLVRLRGNVRPGANAANDRGVVPDTPPMEHMILELRRSPGQEQALTQFNAELHDPGLRLSAKKKKCRRASRQHRHRLIKQGRFPVPTKIGANTNAWPENEIDKRIEARVAERDAE
jgi:prophage regulatory protein